MLELYDVKLPVETDFGDVTALCAGVLKASPEKIEKAVILKRSLDARRKTDIHWVCTFGIYVRGNENSFMQKTRHKKLRSGEDRNFFDDLGVKTDAVIGSRTKVVVAGSGPAGLFAAYLLALQGFKPLLLERGLDVDSRVKAVEEFWKTGRLSHQSNVQFGEGGAGTFSDGKLNTGIKKNPDFRFVLKTFSDMGGGEEIMYDAKPHIGTDRLINVVKNMRAEIIARGGQVKFAHKLTGLKEANGRLTGIEVETPDGICETECRALILAIGHSARDTFKMLYDSGIKMERKPFAVGVRAEHPQSLINRAQYGEKWDDPHLPAADYKLSAHLENGRGVFTFCMCPGGQVVAAASEEGGVCTNGMSYSARNGQNANSALLVGVSPDDFEGSDPLAGVEFQRGIERAAFKAAGQNYYAPVQLMGDFLNDRPTTALGSVVPSYMPGVGFAEVKEYLPGFVTDSLRAGIPLLARRLAGFDFADAVLTGPETRSSSPVRILRDEQFQSNLRGLYPCGEGAGYAGGIMSAAVDGVRVAKCIIKGE